MKNSNISNNQFTKLRKIKLRKTEIFKKEAGKLIYGSIGLQVLEPYKFVEKVVNHIEMKLKKKLSKNIKIWYRLHPNRPVTTKPAEVRMGKGKGRISYFASYIKKGSVILELDNTSLSLGIKVLKNLSKDLGVKTKILVRKSLQKNLKIF